MPRAPRHQRIPERQAIEEQLDRITASADFDTSKRTVDFLGFVVGETLAGRTDRISQHAIAVSVFGRGDDFDPTTDPIVRMQAGRVRRSLEHYYLTAGAADSVSIELPKGSYVPVFGFRETAAEEPSPGALSDAAEMDSWPTLLVAPLRNLTGREDAEFIAQGLASDLAAELSHETAVQVFLSPAAEYTCRARFELSGTLGMRGADFRINFHLVDGETGRQTWAQTFFCPEGPQQGAALDEVVQTTVAMITEERGILASQLQREARRRPNVVGVAYEAILRHHHFDATREEGAFVEALGALRKAVKEDSGCALCWTYLARLGGAHWSLGMPGEVIPIDDSIAAARRGVELSPLDARCRAVLSYVLLLGDEVDEARAEADAALEAGGMSVFWRDVIGYLLILSGDWERGAAILREAMHSNPFPRRACFGALWLDALRRDDADAALAAAREHAPESYFWTPLMEVVALVAGGRVEETGEPVERLLGFMPDFAERGHWLVTRYVKFPELVIKIEQALAEAGVSLRAS
ncbi:hypothetical protein [Haloferula sp. A504]|uniref:hypothetical protein n=1 Tax=Haloferula sp. A504 TaxID=3373601 RepID=UPI0031C5D962|nr:hypothetical protein [Verrucomicrobiaceae bacterium E54]